MKSNKFKQIYGLFFKRSVALWIFIFLLMGVLGIKVFHISLIDLIPAHCILYEKYGLYCTGCGGTRAAVALMNGHFVKSFIYHPAIIYSVLLLMLFVCSDIINNVFKTKKKKLQLSPGCFYIMVGIIIGQCLIKNILLIFFNYKII